MNASAMSLFRMLGDIGYVVGPILMGIIVDMHGANTALFLATFIFIFNRDCICTLCAGVLQTRDVIFG